MARNSATASVAPGEPPRLATLRVLSLDTLAEALTAWYDNNQCREAGDMPGLAVQLVHTTAHLGAARGPLFTDFVTKCETTAGVGEYYSYPDLKSTLHTLGLLPPTATTLA